MIRISELVLSRRHASRTTSAVGLRSGPSAPLRAAVRVFPVLLCVWACTATARASEPGDPSLAVEVPDAFQVTLYADDDLAHDIFSMTTDAQGRIVASGPGYVRILIDDDQNGVADRAQAFAEGPESGAQGMMFHGSDLFCIGDAGLLRYRDRDRDGRADGEPDVFLKLKTGAEHHAHALRRGPDGWWYLIAGNNAGIDQSYVTLPSSPVRSPEAGTLIRLRPDLTGAEVFADGFRNPYDFAFHTSGDLFAFDSDGERDVSLPWYRPIRVFQVLPGTHAGWFSRSWKRPGAFLDMPPVVQAFGRGSPAGVECYRHTQFPAAYRDALFVLDWTFGRVLAVKLTQRDGIWTGESETFLRAVGQQGLALTDVVVGPRGSLYVSVGGRGTVGRVFRIAARGVEPEEPFAGRDLTAGEDGSATATRLAAVLGAPQPLSAWSRAWWMPRARALGAAPFHAALTDPEFSPSQRCRAIEICVELFDGIRPEAAGQLLQDGSAEIRARAAWAVGRRDPLHPDLELLAGFLDDPAAVVRRVALEGLLGAGQETDWSTIRSQMLTSLHAPERHVRTTAARVVARMPRQEAFALIRELDGDPQGLASLALGLVLRKQEPDETALELATQLLESPVSPMLKKQAVRLVQMALSDVGPGDRPPAFDGYTPRTDLAPFERTLDPYRIRLAEVYPTGHPDIDVELARVIAMLRPFNGELLKAVLSRITSDSSPVDDLHHLLVAACIPVDRTRDQTAQIGDALVKLEDKVRQRQLAQDSNWDDRLGELYAQLVQLDPRLPGEIVRHPSFGDPGHVVFLGQVSQDDLQTAVDAFAHRVRSDPEYGLTNDVVFVLGESNDPAHLERVRGWVHDFRVRDAVMMVLAEHAHPLDRPRLVSGIEFAPYEVLTAILTALERLGPSDAPAEQIALVETLRRLGSEKRELQLREQVVRLLRRNTGREFGFVFGREGEIPQPEVVRKWTQWAQATYPELAQSSRGEGTDWESFAERIEDLDWSVGDAQRGAGVFEKRSCGRCHGGRRALGPDLAGATTRFSRNDLFLAIVAPHRDVSPRYHTTMLQTTDGKVYTGLVVHESADGLLLRNATNQTFRLNADEIEERGTLSNSLMPVGLLKDATDAEIADLYAYLRSLSP